MQPRGFMVEQDTPLQECKQGHGAIPPFLVPVVLASTASLPVKPQL